MKFDHPFKHTRDRRGRNCTALLEDLWSAAREWAEREGHVIVPTYGVMTRDGDAIGPF